MFIGSTQSPIFVSYINWWTDPTLSFFGNRVGSELAGGTENVSS